MDPHQRSVRFSSRSLHACTISRSASAGRADRFGGHILVLVGPSMAFLRLVSHVCYDARARWHGDWDICIRLRIPMASALLFWVESGVDLATRIGVDVSGATICPPGVPSARRSAGGDGRTLPFVGRAFAGKGGPDAVKIFQQVRAQVPDVRLLIAGPDRPTTIPEGVEWLGPMTRDELYDRAYPRADLFVYPTRFDTGALVVQEALAHGLPILAPRIMRLPDLVRHGETGYLFEPGNVDEAASATLALLRNPEASALMRTAAREDFERRFSDAHRNQILGDIYRSVARCGQPA